MLKFNQLDEEIMEEYKIETLEKIRSFNSRLNLKSQDAIVDMYHQWSEITACAGWLSPSNIYVARFVEWATTAPCDKYEDL